MYVNNHHLHTDTEIEINLQQLNVPKNHRFFTHIQRGIEKEGLRITPQATIAQTTHFPALGAALTHTYITTDYSEALLEFITPVSRDIDNSLELLQQLHQFTQKNIGQVKSIYRQGLSHRYGRIMQSIAGIHYNFSMPDAFWPHYQKLCNSNDNLQDFQSDRYLGMSRNIQRNSWLLSYLFGASTKNLLRQYTRLTIRYFASHE